MRRDLVSLALVVCLLAAFGLFAWLTRQPDAALFDRLARWPVVGPGVESLQQRYARPAVASAPEPSNDPAAPPIRPEIEYVVVGLGTLVREAPRSDARVVEKTRSLKSLELLERQDSWVRVALDGLAAPAWVDLEAPRDLRPPLGNAPTPPLPLASTPASPEHLVAAEELLGAALRRGVLGPYDLLTDAEEPAWLEELSITVAGLDDFYCDRYGVQPIGDPLETVVVFARQRDYLLFRLSFPRLSGIDSNGHATRGLAALHLERELRDAASVTLVHELVHLLNRRALGPALPPWLDEGLADECSQLGLAEPLELDHGSGSERTVESRSRSRAADDEPIELRGSLAGMAALRNAHRAGRLPTVQSLVSLDWQGFVRSADRRMHYAQSTYWIHFLLVRDADLQSRFRVFLTGVAHGEPADGETLRRHLGRSWELLEADFRAWLLVKAAAAGLS